MRTPKDFGDIYHQATQNIGDPPHAEAYCRCLAMEIERLTREDERNRVIAEIEAAQTVLGSISEIEAAEAVLESLEVLKHRVMSPRKRGS